MKKTAQPMTEKEAIQYLKKYLNGKLLSKATKK